MIVIYFTSALRENILCIEIRALTKALKGFIVKKEKFILTIIKSLKKEHHVIYVAFQTVNNFKKVKRLLSLC